MTKRTFKRLAALLVSSTMIVGSCLTVFADDPAPTSAAQDGTGTYEGGAMQYPTLSVTLPTITTGAYNYIADPNGLIAATSGAAHSGKTFTGTTGVFFPTTSSTYTEKSEAFTVTNQNAQDIDVTIKMEQKTAGSDSIAYSNAASFDTTDKDKKLYLAVTDGKETDPAVSAISSTAAATLTTKVDGKKDNYEAGWTSDGGYKYKLKTGDLTWNDCSYNLTGALNKNATWEDSLTFPTITVTWSFAEHQDAPAAVAPSVTGTEFDYSVANGLSIPVSLGSGNLVATDVADVVYAKTAGGEYKALGESNWTYNSSTNSVVINAGLFSSAVGSDRFVKIVFDDTAETTSAELTITIGN